MLLHIGIDDTDSASKGMCTTYIAALLMKRLSALGEVEEAKLVRLNPNIKYKTRGNAAVALTIRTKKGEEVKRIARRAVEELAVFSDPNTNPGVVFYEGEIPEEFRDFYQRTLHRVAEIEEAERLLTTHGAEYLKYKLGRGIVGALAAIGAELSNATYEYVAYRARERWGKPRSLDPASVLRMDALTFPLTFNNFDYREQRMLIAPHTPCPVLFGIRGINAQVVEEAAKIVEPGEEVALSAVFKTNQGTDAHLQEVSRVAEVEPFSSVILCGEVATRARVIPGGHVFFRLRDARGDEITCAAFEPTKGFRNVVHALIPGDRVKVYGGVDESRTINLEKLEVLELSRERVANPRCERCGRRMESAGRGQGYRCRRCKTRAEEKVMERVERSIEEKLYCVPPIAIRHLAKPLVLCP
ncbi:TiaS agmantine-binding domain-containing protein [Candidatus Pyrohabitans sp.]